MCSLSLPLLTSLAIIVGVIRLIPCATLRMDAITSEAALDLCR